MHHTHSVADNRLGGAITVARGRMTQKALAKALFGNESRQSTISRWERGLAERPTLEEINAIEEVTGKPRGWILVRAGYVELPSSTRDAIVADTALDDQHRDIMLAVYDFGVARSSENK